jgi:hypothetical protein
MHIRQVYEIQLTPRDTPGMTWQDIGSMRPSEVVLEFRLDRGPVLNGGRIIGRRVLRRGRLGARFAESVRPTDRMDWPDWLIEAVNLAATQLATKAKAGASLPNSSDTYLT